MIARYNSDYDDKTLPEYIYKGGARLQGTAHSCVVYVLELVTTGIALFFCVCVFESLRHPGTVARKIFCVLLTYVGARRVVTLNTFYNSVSKHDDGGFPGPELTEGMPLWMRRKR